MISRSTSPGVASSWKSAERTMSFRWCRIESSYPNYGGKTASLDSPSLLAGNGAQVLFKYHMYGSTMGSLHVDVFDGEVWNKSVWHIYCST